LGKSWYDSLQTKVTKRSSHGLVGTAAFTWQNELATAGQAGGASFANDVYNYPVQKGLSGSSVPLAFVTSLSYTTPKVGSSRWMRAAIRDWSIGGIFRYQSGLPIQSPTANNGLSSLTFQSTFANRVPGQPLFLQDLNCHCFDPNKTFVLNPKAWSDPAPGQWGTAAPYYSNYRYERIPSESLSLARDFPIREGMYVQIRAIFFNPFNRTFMSLPTSTNALQTQSFGASGQTVSGFGYINTGTELYSLNPRNGLLQMRFVF
jgi:hypothetical protein